MPYEWHNVLFILCTVLKCRLRFLDRFVLFVVTDERNTIEIVLNQFAQAKQYWYIKRGNSLSRQRFRSGAAHTM